MSLPLISHNEDLLRLVREGYSLRVAEGYLVVDDLPFLSDAGTVSTGRMITALNQNGGVVLKPSTHIMYWTGSEPRDANGNRLSCYHSARKRNLTPHLTVDHQFSNKIVDADGRKRAYASYYEMVKFYATIFCGPATAVDPNASPRRFKPLRTEDGDTSPFAYPDTSAIRDGIVNATARFDDQTIAIIGLGGTGSYILDLVAKTRVSRILLFDDDRLLQHNAFRAPGAVPFTAFSDQLSKVQYFAKLYSQIHTGIEPRPMRITAATLSELDTADFVFIAIDHGPSRKLIFDHLDGQDIPCIDVGLGVELLEDDSLTGQLRTTLASAMRRDHVVSTVPMVPRSDDDDYQSNIQVSDLNALNASLAVVRWKRYVGFYRGSRQEHHSMFRLRDGAHVRSVFETEDAAED